jgi:hypothetical protein
MMAAVSNIQLIKTLLFVGLILKNVIRSQTLEIPIQRRRFLNSCIQGTVMSTLNSRTSIASDNNLLQNYEYREDWVGTSLPILTLDQAASCGIFFDMGRWPDPILRRKANHIDEHLMGSESLKSVAKILRRTARVNQAVGLAAQQW